MHYETGVIWHDPRFGSNAAHYRTWEKKMGYEGPIVEGEIHAAIRILGGLDSPETIRLFDNFPAASPFVATYHVT